ncbi:A disintegrin and metalloproteinase with thrombospondin motifs 20-like [Mizuhopecten yessoensis]|uniref:Hemicentin-1 n=1 Tax=Mizuhopecten yessoensis TaxID=6573 RepID=A0A210QTZ9_MIZYE|nr:A disintegrin and metalloproteinase with thrombospondin motifs 20-like [Mizuhopecten yessoensis]OWF52200.1 Hemicentin-1 [Mizuhopecten yessoensis]
MRNSIVAIAILLCYTIHVASSEKEWMTWTEWTACSTTCEFGLRQRVSRLENEDGSMSNSTRTDHASCLNDVMCPVAGNWTSWTPWSHCSMPCGMGQQKRVRHCANPSPAYKGANCAGPDEQTQECKKQRCPPIPPDFSMDMCADEHRMFLCRSAIQCVNKTFVCDRKVHCHDGSDEMSCYRYHSSKASVSLQNLVSTVITTALCLVFVVLSS